MPSAPALQPVEDIVADLRTLRERGLVRVRHTDLPALRLAASRTGVLATAGGGPAAVEGLLRAAVENLGGGSLGAAAIQTFGLDRAARDSAAQDRRRRAAGVYGVSVERFRKHHERVILEQVAEEILKLCQVPGVARDIHPVDFGRTVTLSAEAAGVHFPVVVHTEPIELLSGVDLVVVPQNIYLEPPQFFKPSVAGSVRRAAARRGVDGEILSDVIADELRSWLGKHGRPGLPVAPGTIAPTSPGELAGQGIRRIYHAAVTVPRPGTNDYDVDPAVLSQAARNALSLARSERDDFQPPLASLGMPLLGAGRGGLNPQTSFNWLWTTIERDFSANGPWELHFITRRQVTANLIINGLTRAGAVPAPPG